MTHPSKELFLQWYSQAATASLDWLLNAFEQTKPHPEYALLCSFIARCISNKMGQEGDQTNALMWADKAMALLEEKNTLRKAYGSDEDYMLSLQSSVVLKVRWLSLSDEHMHWYKAKDLAKDMLATGFPSIYLKGNSSKDGIHLALMLMGVHNRLGEHTKAMDLGTRLQHEAQQHHDSATECRASFNWAISTLLLSKQHAVEGKATDARAALDSAQHVMHAIKSNADMHALIGAFLDTAHGYCMWLQHPPKSADVARARAFVEQWSIELQWGLLDIVQMHSNDLDELLAREITTNLEDASAQQ